MPRVLLSHIPLWRPPGMSCGPRRESPRPLGQGRGANYQNLLDEQASQYLLDELAPSIVFRCAGVLTASTDGAAATITTPARSRIRSIRRRRTRPKCRKSPSRRSR